MGISLTTILGFVLLLYVLHRVEATWQKYQDRPHRPSPEELEEESQKLEREARVQGKAQATNEVADVLCKDPDFVKAFLTQLMEKYRSD